MDPWFGLFLSLVSGSLYRGTSASFGPKPPTRSGTRMRTWRQILNLELFLQLRNLAEILRVEMGHSRPASSP